MCSLRNYRISIYEENNKIIKSSSDTFNIKKPHKYRVDIIKNYNLINLLPKQKTCCIECVNMTSNQAINMYYKNYNVAILNFASALNIGGGYKTGAMAQEEELCRTIPELYPSLLLDDAEYFNWSNDIDFSEDLTVLRKDMIESNGKYNLIITDKPMVSVITASAPNLGGRNMRLNQMFKNNPDLIFAQLKNLIKSIIMTPLITNPYKFCNAPSVLILGAFGCGVFAYKKYIPSGKYAGKQYNEIVANLFVEVLIENHEIVKAYDIISFAIPQDNNIKEGNFSIFKSVILKNIII
jgi:uncharacterized protein (TIGR02452 family)